MRTLTEKYNAVLDGKLSKKQFVRDARLALPNHITQYNGFDDTVAILKNKGMVFEGLDKYKEEKISDHEYTANSQDMFSIEAFERGVDYELEKKGFNTIHRDFTEKDYEKAKEKVITNLEKNPQYYLNILADEPTRVQKKRKDVMKPAEEKNAVDKDNGMVKANLSEGRRPKSKGGKVVKEDDYGNGGYVELMSADLDRGIKLIQKAWDDWKAGPMTEPGMIEHAKNDLITYISNELTFIEDQDTVSEEEIEALQEKKSQLKETFKKLIVNVLSEDKKKVNEDIKGVVDLSSYESQVADVIEKVDPTVQKVDVELSHQEDAELAQAEIVVTPGSMDAEELRDKTIGNPKRFFTGGLRSYFINTLKNVSIDIRDGILYISFDFYVNPFAGKQGRKDSPAFAAKMKRGDYGRLDEKETEQKAFTLDGKVL